MKVEHMLRAKGTRIVSVRMDESVETAARMLRHENIGAVVVKDVCGTEGDTVVGMFSERDFLRALVDQGPGVLKRPVATLMSRDVIACHPRDELDDVITLFDLHHIRHLPVMEGHTLVGVVSIRDIISMKAAEANRDDRRELVRTAA